MAGHIHPVDIPRSFYKPIGQVVAGWNLTEALVASIIWHYHKIKEPPRGRLLVYNHNSVEKLNILLRTAQRYVPSPSDSGALCRLYGEANAVRKARNSIAHGWWGRMPNERHTWKVFSPKEQDDADPSLLRRKITTHNDLIKLAARVRKLNKDLKQFMTQRRIPPP